MESGTARFSQWRIQKLMKGTEDNVSAPSSFIANILFYMGKDGLLKKIDANGGEGRPQNPLSSLGRLQRII